MIKRSQKTLLEKVKKTVNDYNLIKSGDKVIAAVSGGPDSICLLAILKELQPELGFELSACHYNHKLRAEDSDQDQSFVENFCAKEGIVLHLGEAPAKNIFRSEADAREARYAFFEKILKKEGRGTKIALGHNLNDFSETLLMRLFRGAGLKGLRSIPISRENFIRPLLFLEREEIISLLKERNIDYRIDKTNLEPAYLRNRIRLELLPILKKINPNMTKTLATVAMSLGQDYDFILEEAKKAFANIVEKADKQALILNFKEYSSLHPALQSMVLRLAIEQVSTLQDITAKQLDEVKEILQKGVGKKFKILPSSLRIELVGGKILILKNSLGDIVNEAKL